MATGKEKSLVSFPTWVVPLVLVYRWARGRRVLLPTLALLGAVAQTAFSVGLDVPIGEGESIPIDRYQADGESLVIWLPSERGVSPRQAAIAAHLSALGTEVWIADLHAAWLLVPGPGSLDNVPPGRVVDLMRAARERTAKTVYLLAASRTSAIALRAAYEWQRTSVGETGLGGVVLLHPRLYVQTPQGGEDGQYLSIVRLSRAPLYIFQPEQASGRWYLPKLLDAFERAGSPVFAQILPGVSDGFATRPDARPEEIETARRLPSMLKSALVLMRDSGAAEPLPGEPAEPGVAPTQGAERKTLLLPYRGSLRPKELVLKRLDGPDGVLATGRGRVTLVNFWATWCPPCVEEIPSLARLFFLRSAAGLEVLSVDVGESPERIRAFLREIEVPFPVLLDPDGAALREWKVYAYPTTFLIGRDGHIRYAVYGAFAWDNPEILATVDALLAEPSPSP